MRARWGFQNVTELGEHVVIQRYRRASDAAYRRRVMGALREPAAAAGITIPLILAVGEDWLEFERLPGVPVQEADAVVALARPMGELLAAFSSLEVEAERLWADPARLADAAQGWAEREGVALPFDVVTLFEGRAPVLAHGDFAPVNVLTADGAITGLVDFESVRWADPLFDAAWWHWSVGFTGHLDAAWPAFLDGAGLEDDPPRIRALQTLRMLELLAGDTLSDDIRGIVAGTLRGMV